MLCSPVTDRQTDTKVTTEGTLSGFQEFFLQPIIKDRPNNENPSQKLVLLSDNMFDYNVRLLVWAVEGENKVSLHPVHLFSLLANLHSRTDLLS